MPLVEAGAHADASLARWPWPRWAWLVPAVAVAPFLVLLPLAFPQVDDFCFGGLWQEHGLVGMLALFYRTFVGRLFANTVIALPFIGAEWSGISLLTAYRLLCGLVFGGVAVLAFWTVRTVFPRARGAERLFLGLALLAAMAGGSPSPNDLYFWVSQIGNYTIAAAAAFAIMVALWVRAERGAALPPALVAVIAVVGFVTAMATEMSGAVLFVVVCGAFVRRWLEPAAPRQPVAHFVILAALVAGAVIVAVAPGNAARMSVYGQSQGLVVGAFTSIPMTVVRLLNHLYLRAVSPALVAWPVIVALATAYYDRGAAPSRPAWPVVWLPLATAIAATAAALWIGQIGMGQFLPPRARGHLHFILLAGLTMTTAAATRAYGDQVRRWAVARWPVLTCRRVAVAALVLIVLAPNAIHAAWTATVRRPSLAAAIDARFAALEAGRGQGAPLVLPALPPGWPVVIGDIGEAADHWPNACLARFYRLPSVRIGASGG
ncbi:MAG: hypothetical protein JNL66_15940 [Alphaproteobacteria bacterium]|nr:hypothetical protein [Alphaproteobacteria bacterium]